MTFFSSPLSQAPPSCFLPVFVCNCSPFSTPSLHPSLSPFLPLSATYRCCIDHTQPPHAPCLSSLICSLQLQHLSISPWGGGGCVADLGCPPFSGPAMVGDRLGHLGWRGWHEDGRSQRALTNRTTPCPTPRLAWVRSEGQINEAARRTSADLFDQAAGWHGHTRCP